jgi:hypothetical protein
VDPKDLAYLRRARDLMDRNYADPLDVPALARVALMSTGHFARQFRADLRVVNDVSFEGLRRLTLSPPSQPDIEIGLVTPSQSPDASAADREAAAALLAKGLLGGVIFATDNCDATFEKIRAAGAEVLQEPVNQPYGSVTAPSATPRATCSGSPSPCAADDDVRELLDHG